MATYEVAGRAVAVTPIRLVIGLLIVVFASLELSPAFAALAVPSR